MRNPSSAVGMVVVLLLSAWGNVIAASCCPHYKANRTCSARPISQKFNQVEESSCHHQMADLEMHDMQMDETQVAQVETSGNAIAGDQHTQVETKSFEEDSIALPAGTCGHCWMHSQTASEVATLVAVDPAKRLSDTYAPPAQCAVASVQDFTRSIAPQEHGPPLNLVPRHVLSSVLKI